MISSRWLTLWCTMMQHPRRGAEPRDVIFSFCSTEPLPVTYSLTFTDLQPRREIWEQVKQRAGKMHGNGDKMFVPLFWDGTAPGGSHPTRLFFHIACVGVCVYKRESWERAADIFRWSRRTQSARSGGVPWSVKPRTAKWNGNGSSHSFGSLCRLQNQTHDFHFCFQTKDSHHLCI